MIPKDEKLEKALEEVLKWSNVTFPKADIKSVTNHLLLEMRELSEAPNDPGEMADVLMLSAHLRQKLDILDKWVLVLAKKHGIDPTTAGLDKPEICKKRTWGDPDENGVIEHLPHG